MLPAESEIQQILKVFQQVTNKFVGWVKSMSANVALNSQEMIARVFRVKLRFFTSRLDVARFIIFFLERLESADLYHLLKYSKFYQYTVSVAH